MADIAAYWSSLSMHNLGAKGGHPNYQGRGDQYSPRIGFNLVTVNL